MSKLVLTITIAIIITTLVIVCSHLSAIALIPLVFDYPLPSFVATCPVLRQFRFPKPVVPIDCANLRGRPALSDASNGSPQDKDVLSQDGPGGHIPSPLEGYKTQLALLEQQNKKRLMLARLEQDAILSSLEEPLDWNRRPHTQSRPPPSSAESSEISDNTPSSTDDSVPGMEQMRVKESVVEEEVASEDKVHVIQIEQDTLPWLAQARESKERAKKAAQDALLASGIQVPLDQYMHDREQQLVLLEQTHKKQLVKDARPQERKERDAEEQAKRLTPTLQLHQQGHDMPEEQNTELDARAPTKGYRKILLY